MFANLVETSMDAQTTKYAHPGFVRVIEHLTPDEARLLEWMAKRAYIWPCLNSSNDRHILVPFLKCFRPAGVFANFSSIK